MTRATAWLPVGLLAALAALLLLVPTTRAGDIGDVEDFALAKDHPNRKADKNVGTRIKVQPTSIILQQALSGTASYAQFGRNVTVARRMCTSRILTRQDGSRRHPILARTSDCPDS